MPQQSASMRTDYTNANSDVPQMQYDTTQQSASMQTDYTNDNSDVTQMQYDMTQHQCNMICNQCRMNHFLYS
jgi:hypothetical protein